MKYVRLLRILRTSGGSHFQKIQSHLIKGRQFHDICCVPKTCKMNCGHECSVSRCKLQKHRKHKIQFHLTDCTRPHICRPSMKGHHANNHLSHHLCPSRIHAVAHSNAVRTNCNVLGRAVGITLACRKVEPINLEHNTFRIALLCMHFGECKHTFIGGLQPLTAIDLFNHPPFDLRHGVAKANGH